MKIAAFTYDFPHPRSAEMLFSMCCSGFKPEVLICAPWHDLKIRRSVIGIAPRVNHGIAPRSMCEALGIEYIQAKHTAAGAVAMFSGFDLGVILGARIIPQDVIDAFKIGILNIHPGLLPINRGLDAVKWAVHKFIKQGVTAHLIDARVDAGCAVLAETLSDVRRGDTLADVAAMVRDLERTVLIRALQEVKGGSRGEKPHNDTRLVHGPMPPEFEAQMLARWPVYVAGYEGWKGVDA